VGDEEIVLEKVVKSN